jgi:pimeloyl-ACP methyl ester carboxylesterase
MSDNNLLREAQGAFHFGDRKAAVALYTQLVQSAPSSEENWLGLGLALEDTEKRIYCLRRVLEINPENLSAKQALDWLQSLPPPDSTSPPEFIEEGTHPKEESPTFSIEAEKKTASPAEIHENPVPPVKSDITSTVPAEVQNIPGTLGRNDNPPSLSPSLNEQSSKPPIPKKKLGAGLVWFLVILILFVLIVAGLLLAYATGFLDAYLPENLHLLNLYQPTLQQPVSTVISSSSFPTLTPSPASTPTIDANIVYTPIFERGNCPFENPGVGEVDCGFVLVPENHSRSATDTIRLAVVVYQVIGSNPENEPVIFLQGGPGAGAVELSADAYSILVEPFLEKHTFITFDQRGTGLSEPVLNCDELTEVYSQDLRGIVSSETRDLVYLTAFRACHDLFNIGGIDLGAYTTEENASDVKDILQALGYSRADLFGVSYGTRLGQMVMRDYPEIVRSAVLDSMLPLEVNIYASRSLNAEIALQTLFDGCAADPVCEMVYPNLEADFWSLVDLLDTSPISVPVIIPYAGGRSYIPVDGKMYLSQVLASLKRSWMLPGIPQSIEQVRSGDTSSLSYTLGFPPVDWDLEISLGMYISVMCHEYIMNSDVETLTAGLSGRYDEGALSWFPFVGDGENYIRLCESWDAVPPSLGEDEPVTNEIPTLIISGKYDSITPPYFGQLVASHLPNSFYLEFPDQGHVPTAASNTDCPMQTVLSFLDQPDVNPESTCLAGEIAPQFLLPFTESEQISTITSELPEYHIQVKTPEEWIDRGDGIFIRGSSELDITQLDIFRLDATPPQALSILSKRTFYGRIMLDSQPIATGKQTVGGFTWEFYNTTSFGTPVDMALANDHGTTLMVLLFSHTNEHEALRQAVFFPVITSVRSIE